MLGVAFTAAAMPLGNGCTLYLGAPLATAAGSANAHGGFGVRLPLPALAALRGVTLHAQAAVAAPGGSYSWTGAVSATVGD